MWWSWPLNDPAWLFYDVNSASVKYVVYCLENLPIAGKRQQASKLKMMLITTALLFPTWVHQYWKLYTAHIVNVFWKRDNGSRVLRIFVHFVCLVNFKPGLMNSMENNYIVLQILFNHTSLDSWSHVPQRHEKLRRVILCV